MIEMKRADTANRLPRRRMTGVETVFALLLSAAAVTLLAICIQPGSMPESLRGILKTPLLIVLNGLPALVIVAVLYALFGNVFAGASAAALVLGLLSYANRLKMEGRNDPLVPADVSLLRESMRAVGEYQLNLHPWLIVLIALTVAGFAVLAFLLPSARFRARTRLIGAVSALGVFAACLFTIYPNKAFYEGLPDVNKANVPQVYNTYGVLYCFLHNLNLYPIDRPKGYDASAVKQWESETLESGEHVDVNVVFVMGEAFTDLPEEAAFAFQEDDDPIRSFRQLAQSDRAVSGHMTISGFGAGTANTEFEVLTGMQAEKISEHTTSAFRVVHRSLDSLARLYLEDGYRAWLIHPGQSWFYNRCSVYPFLGIREHTFEDAFTQEDRNGTYVSDAAFAKRLKDYVTENGSDGRVFVFGVTIENHQSYLYEKYDHPVTTQLNEQVPLTDGAREMLQVYFHGLENTSDMILNLANDLDKFSAPTLLIFFGDHRPALGADYQAYREIGSQAGLTDTPEQVIYTYEVPWVIWGNEALCRSMDFQAAVDALDLAPGNRFSANYLGSLVYELTGHTGSSAYWDALCQARRILPVQCHGSYYLPDGTYTQTLNDEQAALAQKLHWWEYYRLTVGIDSE